MDLILDEEIEKIYASDKKDVEELIKTSKASTEFSLKTETYATQHELFLQLPNKLVIAIVRYILLPESKEYLEITEHLIGGQPFCKLSAIKCVGLPELDVKFNEMSWSWLLKRIAKGWNSGCAANNFVKLNSLTAARAQLEFIPVTVKKDIIGLFAHKVRYNAVPYLPYQGSYFGVNFAFRVGKNGLEPRVVPLNLTAALLKAGTIWKPLSLANAYLKATADYMPNLVKSHINMAYALGANITRLNEAYQAIDPKVALSIEPHRKERSIFAGVNLPSWSAFFEGFAEDTVGPVSPARMLAALPYTSFYGKIDDIAVWSPTSRILKTPNKLESVVKHVYVEYSSFNQWPANAFVYNPTPQELNAYIFAMGCPAALGMPLTAVISNSPQVDMYCRNFSEVVVEVYFCTTPLVVFRPPIKNILTVERGLDGRGMKDELIALEKAIVKGFLEVIRLKVINDRYTGFAILPSGEYKVGTVSVSVIGLETPASTICTRYMSMTDAELKRFVPTARITDVTIDGVSVAKADRTLVPQYPRAMPKFITLPTDIKIGRIYSTDGLAIADEIYTLDIYNWRIKDPITGVDKTATGETVIIKEPGEIPEEVPVAAEGAGEPAAEKKDEAEEGAYVPPASPTYTPAVDIAVVLEATIADMAESFAAGGEMVE